MGVDDAEVDTLFDIQRLTHVTEVRGQLRISGSLTSLAGLEGIGTVGSLVIDNSSLGATPLPDVSPLAGLSGLRLIRGDLEIRNTRLSSLAFDPLPKIGGNVALDSNYALSTCAVLDFRARLLAQGFTGTFIHTGQELECSGACDRATCVVAAPAAIQ